MPDIFTGTTQRLDVAVAKVVVSDGYYYATPLFIQESMNSLSQGGGMVSLLDFVLLEQISFGEQAAIQKNLTLDNSLFLAVFGDKPQSIVLSGITFAALCNERNQISGIQMLYNFYKNNTATLASSIQALDTNVTNFICQIQIPGGNILKGVVEGIKVSLVSKPFTCYKFTINMVSIPNFRNAPRK